MKRYALIYQPAPGWGEMTWVKTAEELLVPNGTVPLIVWMYQKAAERGLTIRLEEVPDHVEGDEFPLNVVWRGRTPEGEVIRVLESGDEYPGGVVP